QGGEPPVKQVRGERVQNTAGDRAGLTEQGRQFGGTGDDPTDRVPVPTKVFRRAVEGEGGALLQRSLQHGGGERVVDGDGNLSDLVYHRGDIDEFEGRVGGCLQQHQPRLRCDRLGNGPCVAERHLGAEQPGGEQVVGAAVERAHGHHVR